MSSEPAHMAEMAGILHRLHELNAPESIFLPEFDPFESIRKRLSMARLVPPDSVDFLRLRMDELEDRYRDVRFVMSHGPIHGDAYPGNFIRAVGGEVLLADLERFSLGPRSGVLVIFAMYSTRFGWTTVSEYQEFTRRYNFDIL